MGQSIAEWSSAVCAIWISIFLALWRFGVPIAYTQIGYQATLMWGILYNAYYSGGINSPVMIWMGIVPILPLFTVSRRWSYAWLVISFSSVLCIYWAQITGWIPTSNTISQDDLALRATMIGMLCITQVVLVITYDSANSQTLRHITRRNERLVKLSRELENANSHKDKFLSTVSHEMRTPLNAIMGYLGLLQSSKDLSHLGASYVQGAQNSTSHLVAVINDLLDYSQMQQGKFSLSMQTVQLQRTLTESHKTLASLAKEKSLNYRIHIYSNLPEWVVTDPYRINQIFLNLLRNALKFTDKGSVTSEIFFTPIVDQPNWGTLIIEVKDTGVGIASDLLEQIFDPFFQIETPQNLVSHSALRGNGLGLSVAHSLVQKLNGTIEVSSMPNIGSTFKVSLPLEISEPPTSLTRRLDSNQLSKSIRLLVVDDHATNRLVVSATIRQFISDVQIDQARNGTEAIEKMSTHVYDLVLMDLLMPDYSGTEVVRKIRSESIPPFSTVKVIALTANTSEDAERECREVGIAELLPKPFDREVLIRTILKYAAYK
jgi:signal transduction histidine kinase/CheY-like chemotaxis protein